MGKSKGAKGSEIAALKIERIVKSIENGAGEIYKPSKIAWKSIELFGCGKLCDCKVVPTGLWITQSAKWTKGWNLGQEKCRPDGTLDYLIR